jgi:hypothetical protein
MEPASTYETSVNFYQTTRSNNPEDSHLHMSRPHSHALFKICFNIILSCTNKSSKSFMQIFRLHFYVFFIDEIGNGRCRRIPRNSAHASNYGIAYSGLLDVKCYEFRNTCTFVAGGFLRIRTSERSHLLAP